MPFKEAFKLTSDEIIKIIDHFILTGTVTVKKMVGVKKYYFLICTGYLICQIKLKKKLRLLIKIKWIRSLKKIKSGLAKLELGERILNTYGGIS
ncbi:hypothetical protein bpSLO_000892 (plasmid) [Borrelia parkeri]|uniref:hypothetical protein n=1 Tax=Borrelia parkeri TaxID=141 RepID=UPI001FF297AC|nr:hypothetical protein [Borrelia parkeri]UPA11041.1 hypothetical protein bpSLO_000892 [Borrelia parkeri]